MAEKLKLVIEADTSQAEGATGGLGEKLGKLGEFAGKAAIVGTGAILAVGGMSVKAAAEAEAINSRLDNTLKNLADTSGVTVTQADALATSLFQLSGFDDEALKEMVTTLVMAGATSEDIGKLSAQATDLAALLGGDVPAAAKIMARALDNPYEAIRTLEKQGIKLTEAQEAEIKSLQDAGDVAGATAKMFDAMSTVTGGAAAANAATFSGGMEKLQNTLGNVLETIGGGLLPVLTPLLATLSDLAMTILPPLMEALSPVLDAFAQAAKEIIPPLIEALMILIEPILSLVATLLPPLLGLLSPVIELFATLANAVMPIVISVLNKLLPPILEIITNLFPPLINLLIPLIEMWGELAETILPLVLEIGTPLIEMVVGLSEVLGELIEVYLVPLAEKALVWVQEKMEKLQVPLQKVRDFFAGISEKVKELTDKLLNLHIPDWMKPGSPSPLETSLRGIYDAMGAINKMGGMNIGVSGMQPAMAMASTGSDASLIEMRAIRDEIRYMVRNLPVAIRDALA